MISTKHQQPTLWVSNDGDEYVRIVSLRCKNTGILAFVQIFFTRPSISSAQLPEID